MVNFEGRRCGGGCDKYLVILCDFVYVIFLWNFEILKGDIIGGFCLCNWGSFGDLNECLLYKYIYVYL